PTTECRMTRRCSASSSIGRQIARRRVTELRTPAETPNFGWRVPGNAGWHAQNDTVSVAQTIEIAIRSGKIGERSRAASRYIHMILVLICLLAIGVLMLAERSFKHFAFALAVQGSLAAALTLIVQDLDRALLLSTLVAAAIAGASTIKYSHSGLKLTVT